MESLLAIGVGLVLRVVMEFATDNDDRVGGVLVGLWEGVVLNHFVRRMPGSFDPYLGFGFRIFVDVLFTQSLSRLALVALWALVGMLLSDITPNIWRDSGLRHLYRQVRRDVRHVKRAVPRIRIENDLPSMRLFGKSRRTASGMSSSIRSDRASPPRSRAASLPPAPAPRGPPRRQGPSPPGTLPDVSGWSETDTNVSYQQEHVVVEPSPPPSLVSTRERAAYERVDATHVTTSQTQSQQERVVVPESAPSLVSMRERATYERVDTTRVITSQTQSQREQVVPKSASPIPTRERVEYECVDTTRVTASQKQNQRQQAVVPEPLPSLVPARARAEHECVDTARIATSRTQNTIVQNTAVMVTESKKETVVETTVDATVLGATAASVTHAPAEDPSHHDPPTIPDDWVDVNHPLPKHPNEPVAPFQPDPDSTPEPEPEPGPSTRPPSRPTSVLGPPPAIKVLPSIPNVDIGNRASQPPDQIPLPESRAASEIGGAFDEPRPRNMFRDSLHIRVGKATSEIGVDTTKSVAPVVTTQSTKSQSTARSWFGMTSSYTGSKLKQTIVADVPKTSLQEVQEAPAGRGKSEVGVPETQTYTPAQVDPPANILAQPGGAPPLLLAQVEQQGQLQSGKPDLLSPADLDGSSPEEEKEKKDAADSRKDSLFNPPSPTRTPPPPFTEFAGVPEGLAAGEAPIEQDTMPQDEAETVLTLDKRNAEDKRIAFLLTQVQELERSRTDLQKKLENVDDPASGPAKTMESELEDMEKTLKAVKARMAKRKFSEPPASPSVEELSLMGKSVTEVQFAITSAILDMLLARDDAGPMVIRATINRGKPLKPKPKESKDALTALVKRHNFKFQFDNGTPGIVNITF